MSLLATGSGKFLIYSVLPFAFDGLLGCEGSIVVVISPLISLMKNQVRVHGMQYSPTCIDTHYPNQRLRH